MNAHIESTTSAEPARPTPTLGRGLGGVWRLTRARALTPRHWLVVAAAVGVLAAVAYAFLDGPRRERAYPGWIIDVYLTFLLPILAFINAAGALRDDMKPATIDYVLTRPIRRSAFLLFKYGSHLLVAQIEFLIATSVLVALGLFRNASAISALIPAFVSAQVLLVMAFSALGFLFGALTSRYAVLGLLYGAIVEVGVGQIPTQIDRLSLTHQVRMLLHWLARASGGGPWATPETTPGWPGTVCVVLAFTAGALALAALVFSRRELVSAAEM